MSPRFYPKDRGVSWCMVVYGTYFVPPSTMIQSYVFASTIVHEVLSVKVSEYSLIAYLYFGSVFSIPWEGGEETYISSSSSPKTFQEDNSPNHPVALRHQYQLTHHLQGVKHLIQRRGVVLLESVHMGGWVRCRRIESLLLGSCRSRGF